MKKKRQKKEDNFYLENHRDRKKVYSFYEKNTILSR